MSEYKVAGILLGLVYVGFLIGGAVQDTISSKQPIKLSYTLNCEDGKCDTTYKASTR